MLLLLDFNRFLIRLLGLFKLATPCVDDPLHITVFDDHLLMVSFDLLACPCDDFLGKQPVDHLCLSFHRIFQQLFMLFQHSDVDAMLLEAPIRILNNLRKTFRALSL